MNFKPGTQIWTWARCYGRDGRPVPTELNENVLAQYAINVELTLDSLPRRRAGSYFVPFGGVLYDGFVKLGRFYGLYTPGVEDEFLFWTDRQGRNVWSQYVNLGSASFAAPIPNDNFSTDGIDASFCQFNGKMYCARLSTYDRLHVMDRRDATNLIRRVGLLRPTAPSVTNNGAGTYAGFRYYRIQFKTIDFTGRTRRQSNLGDPIGFTPSGAGASVRVSPGTTGGETNITHWVVFGSSDNALYYDISGNLDITTTTFFDDTIAVTNYPNYVVAPEEGAYNTWPSVKYLLAGVDRLIGFGAFGGTDGRGGNVSTPGRVWFSPVMGTTTTDDDERVPVVLAGNTPLQNWIDVGRGTGAVDRGLGGPIDGNILVFQSRGVYLLVPTGNVFAPFKRVTISTDVGAIENSIFTGQDELGRPCVYWLDETAGPYRYGANGLQWLGYDVRDEWALFNWTAAEFKRAHGCFHNDTQTAFFWITQSDTIGVGSPNRLLRFNARLGKDTGPTGVRFGWTADSGDYAAALGSVIIRKSVNGAGASASAIFQPVVATGPKLLVRDPTQITDDGTVYVASVRSKVIDFSGAPFQVKQLVMDWLYLQAPRVATAMQVALFRNFIDQAPTVAAKTLAPPAQFAESRVLLRYEGLNSQDAFALQIELADQNAVAATATWLVDFVSLPIEIRTQERWNVSA